MVIFSKKSELPVNNHFINGINMPKLRASKKKTIIEKKNNRYKKNFSFLSKIDKNFKYIDLMSKNSSLSLILTINQFFKYNLLNLCKLIII